MIENLAHRNPASRSEHGLQNPLFSGPTCALLRQPHVQRSAAAIGSGYSLRSIAQGPTTAIWRLPYDG